MFQSFSGNSARDIQIPQMQFYKVKSYRTFGPVGPHLSLLEQDDIHLIKKLELKLTVNGTVRQNDWASNLVFGPGTLTELSGIQDLFAGDLIATSTPSGCAHALPSPFRQRIAGLLPPATRWKMFLRLQASRRQYLNVGDRVESRIATADGSLDLGVQHNLIVDERP